MKVKHFQINKDGRDFIVGDIHGCFPLLISKLESVDFDSARDRIFSTGDLVDRGEKSHLVEYWLEYPWFHPVRGNHEQMAIDAADGWYDRDNYIANGGAWFLELSKEEQKKYAAAFNTLPLAIEVETTHGLVGIVHAEAPVKKWVDINLSNPQWMMWSREKIRYKDTSIIEGVDKVYVGHTPVKEDIILGNTHFIDTGAFYTGNLTVLEL